MNSDKTIKPMQTIWLVLALTAAGAFLRFYHLGRESLWLDELTVWATTNIHPFMAMIRHHLVRDDNPPLFWILQYPLTYVLKQNEFGVRFLAAVIGSLCVPAIYVLGRQLFNRRTGLFAAALMATSYLGISFSQEARPHILMVLLAIVTMYYWFRICVYEPKRSDFVAYVISAVCLMYTQHYGMLLVLSQCFLALFYFRHIRLKRMLSVAAGIAVLFSPWLFRLHQDLSPHHFWMPRPEWMDIFSYHKYLFERSSVQAILSTLLIAISVGVKIKSAKNSTRRGIAGLVESVEKELLLSLLGFIPFFFAFFYSRYREPILHVRYMVIALPMVILLTASAVDRVSLAFSSQSMQRRFFVGVAVFFILINFHTLFFRIKYYSTWQKDQNRQAATEAIHLHQQLGYPVVAATSDDLNSAYYFKLLAPEMAVDYVDAGGLKAALSQMASAAKGVVVFYFYESANAADFGSGFKIVRQDEFPRFDSVLVLEKLKNDR